MEVDLLTKVPTWGQSPRVTTAQWSQIDKTWPIRPIIEDLSGFANHTIMNITYCGLDPHIYFQEIIIPKDATAIFRNSIVITIIHILVNINPINFKLHVK